jgi:hypothetical protein
MSPSLAVTCPDQADVFFCLVWFIARSPLSPKPFWCFWCNLVFLVFFLLQRAFPRWLLHCLDWFDFIGVAPSCPSLFLSFVCLGPSYSPHWSHCFGPFWALGALFLCLLRPSRRLLPSSSSSLDASLTSWLAPGSCPFSLGLGLEERGGLRGLRSSRIVPQKAPIWQVCCCPFSVVRPGGTPSVPVNLVMGETSLLYRTEWSVGAMVGWPVGPERDQALVLAQPSGGRRCLTISNSGARRIT